MGQASTSQDLTVTGGTPYIPFVGGYDASPTSVATRILLAGVPAQNFVCDAAAYFFYFLDSASSLWRWSRLAPGAPVKILDGTAAWGAGVSVVFMALSSDGTTLYATTTGNKIVAVTQLRGSPVVAVLAGSGTAASTDGSGAAAAFNVPSCIALSYDGTKLWVTDNLNTAGTSGTVRLRLVTIATGAVITVNDPNYANTWLAYTQFSPVGNIKVAAKDVIWWSDQNGGINYNGTFTIVPFTSFKPYTDGKRVGPFEIDSSVPMPAYVYALTETSTSPETWNTVVRYKGSSEATQINPLSTVPNNYTQSNAASLSLRRDGCLYTVDPNLNLLQIG